MKRRGVALIVVLWIGAVLTLLMYAFLAEMRVEYALSSGFADRKKAEQLAWSGIEAACLEVEKKEQTWHTITDSWSDNDSLFYEVPLGEGAFTVMHPVYSGDGRLLWGLEDEASKVNLNYASREMLVKLLELCGVTGTVGSPEEIADAIIDWRDEDSEQREYGAEDTYYGTLDPPYRARNRPFETVEELLLVRGITPEILYGEDTNLNGVLDPAEDDGDENPPYDDRDGELDVGLYAYVTVVSRDENVTHDGERRLNVNNMSEATSAQIEAAGLTGEERQRIEAYASVRRSRNPNENPYPSVAHVYEPLSNGTDTPQARERFKEIADGLTTSGDATVPALVNVNTAPEAVLLALPGISEELAIKIIQHREQPGVDLSNMGWLLDVMEPRELQGFARHITVRSHQFRIHAIGRIGKPYDEISLMETSVEEQKPTPFVRMVAVFDLLAEPRPRIIYWKDMTKHGMPYDPFEGPDVVRD